MLHLLAFTFLAFGMALALAALLETKHSILLWRSRRVLAKDMRNASGIFDIRGSVKASRPLTGPLTGRPCVQYTVVMERRQPKSGQKRDGDPDLITFIDAAPFVVDDGTGRVHIDLREQHIPVTGTSIVKRPLERLTAPLEKLLSLRLHKPGGLWCMGRDIVATEAALVDGDEVSVVGRRDGNDVIPLHVTTGRTRVVAMQGLTRAGAALCASSVLFGLYMWLR
jgi:hypothetical protein